MDNLPLVLKTESTIFKIAVLDDFSKVFLRREMLDEAEEYNELYFKIQRDFYFPDVDSQKVVSYHCKRGQIQLLRAQYL